MAGQMVSSLVRVFGAEHLQLAEDVVQETLIKAFQVWQFAETPANPEAWLVRTARNRAVDALRHESSLRKRAATLAQSQDQTVSEIDIGDLDDPFGDDRLAMMFLCCHPTLPEDTRLTLTLKTVGGLSVREIASAFLIPEETIAQRIVRAKRKIRQEKILFELPDQRELSDRLESVTWILYLMFNEGYFATTGDSLVRRDLCQEAIELTALLAERLGAAEPRIWALLALMYFHASRFNAREDEAGWPLLLDAQNRDLWDRTLIAEGMRCLNAAKQGSALCAYHLEAAIAAAHCIAPKYGDTDWQSILYYYEVLVEMRPTPVIRLNHAIAHSMVHGPESGITMLDQLRSERRLSDYHLLDAAMGELQERSGHFDRAQECFDRAIRLATNDADKRFLQHKCAQCTTRISAA